MHTIYYIDTENISYRAWKQICAGIQEKDVLAVFYTEKASRTDIGACKLILDKGILLKCIKCYDGKNALDFQLISMLGYNIARCGRKCAYRIISNDTGYDPALQFWEDKGLDVKRIPIQQADINPEKPKPVPKENLQEKYRKDLMAIGLSAQQAQTTAEKMLHLKGRPQHHIINTIGQWTESKAKKTKNPKLWSDIRAYILKELT